jgi:1-acyl-sn-glycerol-3-phosphate acyltransferase
LADEKELLLKRKPAKMILHEALDPTAFESYEQMSQACFEVIQNQLLEDNRLRMEIT